MCQSESTIPQTCVVGPLTRGAFPFGPVFAPISSPSSLVFRNPHPTQLNIRTRFSYSSFVSYMTLDGHGTDRFHARARSSCPHSPPPRPAPEFPSPLHSRPRSASGASAPRTSPRPAASPAMTSFCPSSSDPAPSRPSIWPPTANPRSAWWSKWSIGPPRTRTRPSTPGVGLTPRESNGTRS